MSARSIKTETWRAAHGAVRAYRRLAATMSAEWREHEQELPAAERDEWRRMHADVEEALVEAAASAAQRFLILSVRAGWDKEQVARSLREAMAQEGAAAQVLGASSEKRSGQ